MVSCKFVMPKYARARPYQMFYFCSVIMCFLGKCDLRYTGQHEPLPFPLGGKTNRLRDEFGALEAPGWSEDETKSLEESQDEAWDFVFDLVNKAKKNRPV